MIVHNFKDTRTRGGGGYKDKSVKCVSQSRVYTLYSAVAESIRKFGSSAALCSPLHHVASDACCAEEREPGLATLAKRNNNSDIRIKKKPRKHKTLRERITRALWQVFFLLIARVGSL